MRHKSGNEEIVRVERKMEGERCERGVAQFASCKACEIMSDSDHDKRAEHLTTRDMKLHEGYRDDKSTRPSCPSREWNVRRAKQHNGRSRRAKTI